MSPVGVLAGSSSQAVGKKAGKDIATASLSRWWLLPRSIWIFNGTFVRERPAFYKIQESFSDISLQQRNPNRYGRLQVRPGTAEEREPSRRGPDDVNGNNCREPHEQKDECYSGKEYRNRPGSARFRQELSSPHVDPDVDYIHYWQSDPQPKIDEPKEESGLGAEIDRETCQAIDRRMPMDGRMEQTQAGQYRRVGVHSQGVDDHPFLRRGLVPLPPMRMPEHDMHLPHRDGIQPGVGRKGKGAIECLKIAHPPRVVVSDCGIEGTCYRAGGREEQVRHRQEHQIQVEAPIPCVGSIDQRLLYLFI